MPQHQSQRFRVGRVAHDQLSPLSHDQGGSSLASGAGAPCGAQGRGVRGIPPVQVAQDRSGPPTGQCLLLLGAQER
jgi:hypothetical protein